MTEHPLTMDSLLSQSLKDYIINTTSPESTHLQNLRKETMTQTAAPQMLSGPVEGMLLQFLVKLLGAKHCLEVGTFTGYSALHIANALPLDGKLITCENQKEHAAIAQKYFDLSPHGHKITLRLGDAMQTLPTLHEPFDLIFLDADKSNYPLYYDLLIPKLRTNGLLIVDNALWKGKVIAPQDKQTMAIDALNQKARHDPLVQTVMLSVRDGILLIRKG